MEAMLPVDEEQHRPSYAGLVALILGLVLGAAVLAAFAGPPHLPAQLLTWNAVGSTLRGSSLPLSVLAYILTMAAWAVWLWIVASLLLRLLVATAEAATDGAAWAHTLRSVSDRVTLPLVRRAVDGALIAAFVVNMTSRTIPSVAVAAPPPMSTPHVATVRSHAKSSTPALDSTDGKRPRNVEYTVQPGDTLWGIAERFYGTGYEFPRLIAANTGQQMSDGERFTQAGVLQPGWVLRVPLPSDRVHEANGGSYYVVEEGDTLRGIAARLLGGEDRWMSLFNLNRDRAKLDGHLLTEPNLIWPGLDLRVPLPIAGHGGPGTPSRPSPPNPTRKKHATAPRPTPVGPTPTSIPPSPNPEPTAVPSAPIPVATAAATVKPAHNASDDTALLEAIAGAAGAAAAGGALLLARRRVRRRLSDPPIPAPRRQQPVEDFADAEPARVLAHRLHSGETEPIVLIAEQARRFLAERGLDDVSIVLAQQDRNTATLVLRAGLEDQERIMELAGEIGGHLGGKGRAYQTADRDIALQLSRLSLATLTLPRSRNMSAVLRLLPLGMLPDEATLSVNWAELGHVLVAGLPGGGIEVILTSILGTLAARCRPEELRLWTVADRRSLPLQLLRLPHQSDGLTDPTDKEKVNEALEYLREVLTRRMRASKSDRTRMWLPSRDEPELLLVLGELTDVSDDGTTLEMIGTHGPDYGVRLVAASTRADALTTETLGYFGTRLLLQTFDDEESIRLLGQPDGSDLGGGELYLRLGGRSLMRLRGFRISTDHLDQLVQLMSEAYGERVSTAWPTEPGPCPPDIADNYALDEEGDAQAGERLPGKEIGNDPSDLNPVPMDTQETLSSFGHHVNSERPGSTEADRLRDVVEETPSTGAVIQVRCFGDFVVRSGDREINPTGEEGASYKAWELLAFLAAQPDGVVSRDKLIAAVWPDVDMERAVVRMRTAMKRLRAMLARQVPSLSRDVVRADRDGVCRLDTSLVSSDVHQFAFLLRDSSKLPPQEAEMALEAARVLYRDDLLSGRAAQFYEWVDDRADSGVSLREHYREEYYRATQRLARIHLQEGQAERAVPLYKSILKAEPTLEDVVRELYRCYKQLGDLSSLVREDRHLRQALRGAYFDPNDLQDDAARYEPEPETITLYRAVRRELEAEAGYSHTEDKPTIQGVQPSA